MKMTKLLPAAQSHGNTGGVAEDKPQSKTMTVNAAFLQEIKEEHVNLSALLFALNAWLNRGPSVYHQRDRFIDLLAELQDALALQFSLEEGYGYFEDAVAVAPALSSRAAALRDEHKALYVAFNRLVQQAETTRTKVDGFGNVLARARAFLDQFQQHERRERELIVSAYNDDFGVGD